MDVADHTAYPGAVGTGPGIDLKRAQIRHQQHVGLFDADEPLDRGAVEHDLPVEGLFELTSWHFHVLQNTHDVGELEAQEAHILSVSGLQNLGFG